MTLSLAGAEARTAAAGLLVAGIGELVSSSDPSHTLVSYGLGSCVALTAWDPRTKAAALAHFMLPSGSGGGSPVKFVDEGFIRFVEAFRALGGFPNRAQFKAAGGASMLAVMSSSLDIGRRNGAAVEAHLAAAGLRLVASDLGGKAGRTVQLAVSDGRLLVKSVAGTTTI
jgi:chemotaxis protein CheD